MNIFAYDQCPTQSAKWLDDIRKNKMIVESAQLLSTAMHQLQPKLADNVYRPSYVNHPCAVWARASLGNFVWLLTHMEAMVKQRVKPHKSANLLPEFRRFAELCDGNSRIFPQKNMTPFANCARNKSLNVDFTHIPNTHAAYRLYSKCRWQNDTIKLSWEYGEEPYWRN